jgi:hypothetical protein
MDKISPEQVATWNKLMQELINEAAIMEQMQDETSMVVGILNEKLNHQKEYMQKLEMICFIHGINDLPCWIAKSNDLLLNMLVDSNENGWNQMPFKFRNKYDFNE